MDFKLAILDRVTKWLVGGELFNFVKQVVDIANTKDYTSEEKREYVQSEVLKFFSTTGMVIVNLAIEVAVMILKSKMESDYNDAH